MGLRAGRNRTGKASAYVVTGHLKFRVLQKQDSRVSIKAQVANWKGAQGTSVRTGGMMKKKEVNGLKVLMGTGYYYEQIGLKPVVKP